MRNPGGRVAGRGERREGEGRRRPAAWEKAQRRQGERIDLGRRRLGRRLASVRAASSEKSDAEYLFAAGWSLRDANIFPISRGSGGD